MPRWYDFPPIWFGLQVALVASVVWLVRRLGPQVFEEYAGVIWGGAIVAVGVVAYLARRRLIARDDARGAVRDRASVGR
jgi:hypothetical protein